MCFANLTLDAINFGIKNLERFANFVGQGVMGWFGKKDVGKLDLSGWMIENPERFTKSGEDAANAYYGAYARTLFDLSKPIGDLLPGDPNARPPSQSDEAGK